MSPTMNVDNVCTEDCSDEDSTPVLINKKRIQRFSDSETEKENVPSNENEDRHSSNSSDDEPDSSSIPTKSRLKMSRTHVKASSSDSDGTKSPETIKNNEQQLRMKNKRNRLRDKFSGLLNSRAKELSQVNTVKDASGDNQSEGSEPSDSEMTSIAKIKQKIKKGMASMSSICDPDTSDEDDNMNTKQMPKQRQKKQQKSAKLTEPKPIRMSAKQAMENMQLIKSESNRMLREKAVSLPYHRPKALSLKDIMARRKPALTSDGKAFPIKMNEDQLKQYANLLEQRQKEMMELCKSESDEEILENYEKCDDIQPETDKYTTDKMANTNIDDTEKSSNIILENETILVNEDASTNMTENDDIQNPLVETDLTKVEYTTNDGNENYIDTTTINTNNELEEEDKNDYNTDFKLVYNDSIEEDVVKGNTAASINEVDIDINKVIPDKNEEQLENSSEQQNLKIHSEPESQLILHYSENNSEQLEKEENAVETCDTNSDQMDSVEIDAKKQDDFFSDDDINMEDIDRLIENAEVMKDDENTIKGPHGLHAKPKLMGAPGMVIDLDGGANMPSKLTGIEQLKERFIYFSKLKTPEELERQKEKTVKPGAQHLKLKQKLEDEIAEQRSLEWAKRLEEEKQQHKEMESILDDDAEESFEKPEANLDNDGKEELDSSESEEEELEENDVDMKDKPRKNNPMVDDEAEESDCDDEGESKTEDNAAKDGVEDGDDNVEQEDDEEEDSSEEESSESEEEETTTTRKGRILKAFEDSDDEDTLVQNKTENPVNNKNTPIDVGPAVISNELQGASQDDVIQLAQRHKSASDDLFTSQESSTITKDGNSASDDVLGTQTFSILDSTTGCNMDVKLKSPSNLNALCMSQPYLDPNLNAIVDGSQLPITQSSQSQPLGEDILALCTGKFYDNEFISQTHESQHDDNMSQEPLKDNDYIDNLTETVVSNKLIDVDGKSQSEEIILENVEAEDTINKKPNEDGVVLKSILDELDDPEFDKHKPNKFFTGGTQMKVTDKIPESSQMKKKFTIDSDDETVDTNTKMGQGKKKKLKKRKAEKRALHISDDEEDEPIEQEEEEYEYNLEEDNERFVEYDSEENEIEVQPDKPKKKRKVDDFFEQEAELTSEDEWVGSGDEDEKDLDKMEREAGDDEVFHQGKLRKELGQIHMRDVLDQDKREVRMLQELLFEDGDLGDGHRQRKFRWRNAGEDDGTGTIVDQLADTQEDEFESEEQWRKQRHERELFLKAMQQKDEEETTLNVSVNRNTIIKANLLSKSMSTLLEEVNQTNMEKTDTSVVQEKKTCKDIPSPKKSFSIFQQNYHGSLLTRGRGALARLAALATPLAVDDDTPKTSSLAPNKGNFVFATLTPKDKESKVTIKRKAEANLGTPKLVKKMKLEEKQTRLKSSLLDHLNL